MKLLDYIRGFRSGKEAHRLEKESMRDPFLADAIDGYQQTEGNHEQQLERLYSNVAARSKKKNYSLLVWGAVASLLVGVFISGYFLLRSDKYAEEHLLVQGAVPEATPLVEQNEVKEQVFDVGKEPDSVKTESAQVTQIREQQKNTIKSTRVVSSPRKAVLHKKEVSQTESKESPVALADSMDVRLIRGTVTDRRGEPLVGASISVKGTTEGTISDVKGNFALQTNGKKELDVYFIGYEPVSLSVDTAENLLIAMNEDKFTLNETVVVGSGTFKKVDTVLAASDLSWGIKSKPVIGQELYEKYLKENLIRPVDSMCNQIEGDVIVRFYVDKKGRPVDITVKQSLCPSSDREAIRLVREGPGWMPGSKAIEVRISF